MVATFYCFLTSEVRNEMRKKIRRWEWSRNISRGGSCQSTRSMSVFNHSTQVSHFSMYSSKAPSSGRKNKVAKAERKKKSDDGDKKSPLISGHTTYISK